jgi:hypothetical protein
MLMLLVFFMIVPVFLHAEVIRFDYPTVDNIALDWCLTWAADCGKPAADYFCRLKGYQQSVNFQEAQDVGYTKLPKTGQICSAQYCDSFAFVDCQGYSSTTPPYNPGQPGQQNSYSYPSIRGYRLDWCRLWATDCGQGAADSFCRSMGYSRAISFDIDSDIGLRSPTMVIESGQICSEAFCDGFKYINCQ